MNGYLLRRADIEALAGTAKRHFLNSDARRTNKSLGDLTGLATLGIHLIEVPPGASSTELHAHTNEDECCYVLAGEGEVTLGDEVHAIGAGDFIGYRAGGVAHCMTNTGREPLLCIVAGTRLAHDVVDYPRLGKRLFRSAGQPWQLVDVANIERPAADAGKK